ETVEGILKHSKGRSGPVFASRGGLASVSLEALIVRAADLYAYASHDLDDAYLLGELRPQDLPSRVVSVLGAEPSDVRRVLVQRTIESALARGEVSLEPEADAALDELRAFLYERLYEAPRIARQTAFVRSLVEGLWESACNRPLQFLAAVAPPGVATCPD